MAMDWEAIKTEYITTDTSQSKLAKKYGVPRSTICKWCAREGWVEQRERYRAGVVQKTIDRRAHEDVKHLEKLMGAAERITEIAVDALQKEQALYTIPVDRDEEYSAPIDSKSGDVWTEDSTGVPVMRRRWNEDRVSDAVNTRALKDLASVVKEMTSLIRDFYDIPTAAQREQRDINRERLELDKKRAEQGEAGGSITIIVPKDAEGLDE